MARSGGAELSACRPRCRRSHSTSSEDPTMTKDNLSVAAVQFEMVQNVLVDGAEKVIVRL